VYDIFFGLFYFSVFRKSITFFNGRIILKCILDKWDGEAWTGSIWLRIGTCGGGPCECVNEPSSSIKGGKFLE
jgi:hypothetical protein